MKLFPSVLSNQYEGSKIALYGLYPIFAIYIFRSLVHFLAENSGLVGIATIKEFPVIEGLDPKGQHPVQQAWLELQVPQCGYCQSGQMMNAAAFLDSNPSPTDGEILEAMQGNLCRCITYVRIKQGVRRASEIMGA